MQETQDRKTQAVLTATFFGLLGDFDENQHVGDDDDDEWSEIHGHDVEDVVGEFESGTRKRVESDALREPRERRMPLLAKHNSLQTETIHSGYNVGRTFVNARGKKGQGLQTTLGFLVCEKRD